MTELQENQTPDVKNEKKKGKKEKAKKTPMQEALSWVLTLAAAVVLALVIRTCVFEPIRVDGGSMSDTLHNGEITFTFKTGYLLGAPGRQDVVICHYPGRRDNHNPLHMEMDTNFVKRVIGLPGETVEIRGNVVYINGEALEEPYLNPERNRGNHSMAAVTLGENEYFVMGDNRDNSNDSRNLRDVGPITRDMIVGHVKCVLFPLNQIRGVE